MTRGLTGPLLQFIPREFERLLRARDLRVPEPALGGRQGLHASRRGGPGLEFREHRPYQPGDDLRRLDWRAAGRNDRLVIRQTRGDDERPLVFLLDRSGAMDYGEGDSNKWSTCRALVATLGVLALSQGDPIGLALGAAGGVWAERVRARGDFENVRAIAGALSEPPERGHCPWPELLEVAARSARAQTQFILISDFLDPGLAGQDPREADLAIMEGARHLSARGHGLMLVQLLHPDELELPWKDAQTLVIEDPRGQREHIDGSAGQMREGYRQRVREHLAQFDTDARNYALSMTRIVCGRDLEGSALELLERLAGDHRASPGTHATRAESEADERGPRP